MNKKYALSVVDFALPAPYCGSIDSYSGFGQGQLRGMEIHQELQAKIHKENPNYQAELRLAHTFTFEKYKFEVSGKTDGIYYGKPNRLEEIKTAFDLEKLARTLKDKAFTHPYCLQLQTYAYIHWQNGNTFPLINLLLVSARNKKILKMDLEFNLEGYEVWLKRRFKHLV